MIADISRDLAQLQKRWAQIGRYIQIADLNLYSDKRLMPLVRQKFYQASYVAGPIVLLEEQVDDVNTMHIRDNYAAQFMDCIALLEQTGISRQIDEKAWSYIEERTALREDNDIDDDDQDDIARTLLGEDIGEENIEDALTTSVDMHRKALLNDLDALASHLVDYDWIDPEVARAQIEKAAAHRVPEYMLGNSDSDLASLNTEIECNIMMLNNQRILHCLERLETDLGWFKACQEMYGPCPVHEHRNVMQEIKGRYTVVSDLITEAVDRVDFTSNLVKDKRHKNFVALYLN